MEMGLYVMAVVMTSAVLEVKAREANFTAVFPANSEIADFNHTVVDYGTGRVFVGAMNKIYMLNSKLQQEMVTNTGPVDDNPLCTYNFFDQATCVSGTQTITKTPMNNVNKVLVIDSANRHLITCGSVQQGTCQIRNLPDISNVTSYKSRAEYYIAANDPTSSTVAFVGPGIDNGKGVLYVATSFTKQGPGLSYRSDVPAVSSRNLDGPNILRYSNKDDLTGAGTYVRLASQARDQYLINYVAGFSHDGFSYFLTTQKEFFDPQNPSDKYVSKIIQVCQNDREYRSYVEMELKCKSSDGTEYNLVQSATMVRPGTTLANNMEVPSNDQILIATFSKSVENTDEPTTNSAICMFRFSDIRANFTENIKKCFNGEQSELGKHFGGTCTKASGLLSQINDRYCGAYDINAPLSGEIPVESVIAIPFPDSMLTAITVDVTGAHSVAFVGTSTGHLKKVLLDQEETGHGREFDDITVSEGHPIKQDLHLSADGHYVLVLTSSKLYKIPVSECGRFGDCGACRDSRDPYCGWCSLENKCSIATECQSSDEEKRWLSYKAWECVGINWYQPHESSVQLRASVTLNVKQLPPLKVSSRYECWFGSDRAITVASISGNDVTCQTPALSVLPKIPGASDHIEITLAIRSTETNKSFLKTKFTFYNCSRHSSCSKCTDTSWDCNWCIHDGKCTHQGAGCTPQAEPVYSKERCPRLERAENEVLLPVGYSQSIEIPASNLPVPLVALNQTGYECLLHLETPPIRVPAVRVSESSVRCEPYAYNYLAEDAKKTVSLEVIWNGRFLIDDNNARTVEAYKCNVMGLDCSMCMSLVEKIDTAKYRCKWCNVQGGLCKYQETCKENETVSKCPDPYISVVSPLSGPIEGGTEVTIKGSNLGQRFAQVETAVTIAGESCPAIEDSYIISREIVCTTKRIPKEKRGNVQVTIDSETVAYEIEFRYQNPQIEAIFPKQGPRAGGTKVTVTGSSLDTGEEISVKIGTASCAVISVNSTQLVCETSSVLKPDPYDGVTVYFDGAERRILDESFNYEENPDITDVTPLDSYVSGGRTITVKGHNLDTVQRPEMFLTIGSKMSKTSLCEIVNGGKLLCQSPSVHPNATRQRRQAPVQEYSLGLLMDGVLSTRNVSVMTVHPDPVYFPFEEGQRLYKGGSFELTGENLNAACTAKEVTVMIGEEHCVVKTLDTESLFCDVPEKQPFGKNGQGALDENALPLVTVQVGTSSNLRFELGSLKYQVTVGPIQPSEYWIIGVAVGGGIVITVFIIIVIVYKRRSSEAERQYKKMQIQLDALESNVRNECKQAFAELQTEVGDFTSDLNVIGIPFWDYKSYTFKVLFPSHNDHPILHNSYDIHTNKFGGYEQGLQQFNQLLNSKHFLIIFIRTLEAQKNFSIRDKSIVASLVMIVLQDKMEYATEILKSLLNELVDRSVEKKHPKLMLRRTESVVEKLLANWLSLCMYVYLKKHAGKTLFMLFKAIKHQTEKGPIDGITAESRYSLSEDRLLREKIEAKTLNVYLVSEATRDPVACKLLDCDTITQAKEKVLDAIYMNTPFSRRPAVYDVDLEWRSGRSGHLPLQDEDVTTDTVHGWKKVNTIAHYHVPDGATMALVPTRNKSDLVRHVHGMVELSTGSSLSAITPIITMEEGTKVWHLLKHDDSHNAQRSQKVISEIFLTRLLATKGTLQQYIDDLFMTILRVDSTLPPAVKYLFDFLDNAARRHNIVDPEVVHTWKCNSLPLRFWVNIIKNPEFVFDIHKSHIVDSCLSVIAQTFMDSCSAQEHRLGKDSPSNKLLFAKDIPKYRQWMGRFYKNVSEMPPVSDAEMTRVMTELSMTNLTDFNVSVALKELYKYATQYNFELLEALDDDPSAKKMHLASKFEQVAAAIEGTPLY